jgi:hypothetical protein
VVEFDGRTVDYSYDFLRRLTQEKITHVGGAVTQIDYSLDLAARRRRCSTPWPIADRPRSPARARPRLTYAAPYRASLRIAAVSASIASSCRPRR